MKKLLKEKGFTLVELMVVIAIIAVLAVIIAPQALKSVEKARISSVLGDYQAIKTGAFSFNADTATWPANDCEEAFSGNDNCASGTYTGWDGPYVERWPVVARWQGSAIKWCKVNAAAVTICEAWDANTNEKRYVRVTLVPLTAAQRLDEQIDGSQDGTDGFVRYATGATTTTLKILVSED